MGLSNFHILLLKLFIKTKKAGYCKNIIFYYLFSCITWTLTNHLDKNLDGNYTKMLDAIGPLTSHLTNHLRKSNKMCWALLVK